VLPAGLLGLAACGDPGPADAVRKTIGPGGGLIASHDDVLSIVILPGALDREVEIEVFPSNEPPPIFGPAYRVRPHVELAIDAEITYRRVLPSNPNAASVAAIRIDDYTAEMGHWVPLPRLALQVEQEAVIAIDDELSLYYGLLEDTSALPLPGDDGNDSTPPSDEDDDGPSTGSTGGSTSDSGEPVETTMSVEPTTGEPVSTTDDGSGSTSEPGGTSSSGGMGDEMGDDGPMPMPVCADGMPQVGELCLVAGGDAPTGLGPLDVGTGDLDGNGTIDVVVNNVHDTPDVWLTSTAADRSWLMLRLVGTRSNRSAIGARVRVVADGVTQIREVHGGGSYLSQNDLRVHVGLGAARLVERVEVRWPNGLEEVWTDVAVNQRLTLTEGKGTALR